MTTNRLTKKKPFSKHVHKLKKLFRFYNKFRRDIFPEITEEDIYQIDDKVYVSSQEAKLDLGKMAILLPDKIILVIVRLLQLLKRFIEQSGTGRIAVIDFILKRLIETFELEKRNFFTSWSMISMRLYKYWWCVFRISDYSIGCREWNPQALHRDQKTKSNGGKE